MTGQLNGSWSPRSDYALGLATVVLAAHLIVHVAHTVSHLRIPVLLPPALSALTVLVAYGLPVVGVWLVWRGPRRTGAAVFAAGLAGSLLLGLTLHFGFRNPDHLAAVSPGAWAGAFRATAAAAAVVDAGGVAVAAWIWRRAGQVPEKRPSTSGRVDGVHPAGWRPLVRLAYWATRHRYGSMPEPVSVAAHSRPLLVGWSTFEMSLDFAARVDDQLTKLAAIKVATAIGCEFCTDFGTALAADLGIRDAKIRDINRFEDSDAFTERERLVLRYAKAMTDTPARVPDELFDALSQEFADAELVEITAAVAFENYRARFNRAFEIGSQGFSDGEPCPVPTIGRHARSGPASPEAPRVEE